MRLMKAHIALKTWLHTKAVVPACGFICLLVTLCLLAPSVAQADYHCSDPYGPDYVPSECDRNRPKPLLMPLMTLDGEKISLTKIPRINLSQKHAWGAYRNGMNFYLPDNPICPTTSWRSRDKDIHGAITAFTKYISDRYGQNLKDHVQGGCKGKLIFDQNKNLLVSVNSLENSRRYSPITIMVTNMNLEKTFFKGMLEYREFKLIRQKARVLLPDGKEICKGELKFSSGDDGYFDFVCFDQAYEGKGEVRLKEPFTKKGHSLGSGSFSDGTKIDFVTSITGKAVAKKYPIFSGLNTK